MKGQFEDIDKHICELRAKHEAGERCVIIFPVTLCRLKHQNLKTRSDVIWIGEPIFVAGGI